MTIKHGSYSGKKVTEGLNSDCVWVAVLPRNMASDPDKIWFLVRGEISQSCAWKYGKRTVLDVMRVTMYLLSRVQCVCVSDFVFVEQSADVYV